MGKKRMESKRWDGKGKYISGVKRTYLQFMPPTIQNPGSVPDYDNDFGNYDDESTRMTTMMMLSLWLQPAVLSMLEGVILLDADDNRVISSYDDAASLPNKLVCHRR